MGKTSMLRVVDHWRQLSWRPSPRRVRQWLEVALVLLLAFQASRLIYMIATPSGPLGESPKASPGKPHLVDLSVLERFDPFFRVEGGVSQAASDPAAGGGLLLFGVRTDGRGGGSAILGSAGGAQNLYGLGEDVGGGQVLSRIFPDHVILARGGAHTRVDFAPSQAPAAPVEPVGALAGGPPRATGAGGLDPAQFLAAAALTPATKDGQLVGYRVMARGRGEALAKAGLQDGDVILSVDGSALNPERLSELPDLLSQAGDVEVRFERNGQSMTTRLNSVSR